MKPHRARMGDKVLSDLVFVKCNKLKKHSYKCAGIDSDVQNSIFKIVFYFENTK